MSAFVRAQAGRSARENFLAVEPAEEPRKGIARGQIAGIYMHMTLL